MLANNKGAQRKQNTTAKHKLKEVQRLKKKVRGENRSNSNTQEREGENIKKKRCKKGSGLISPT